MNKSAIQKFAVWARNELIEQVAQRAYQYGVRSDGCDDAATATVNGRLLTAQEKEQRRQLVKQIEQKGFNQAMEEVAYTWFNRFIALRFMEVNGYLPTHIRVFSDNSGAFKPELLSEALHIDLPELDRELVDNYIESNESEQLYRYLLLTQCNALSGALPVMFEQLGGYTELLLPNNILRQDSVLGHLVTDIPEEDWRDAVQIIGWLYQYYNSELKDDTFAQLKKNVKISKERIPAATQLFTPDWIVRYMVENSLGRIYINGETGGEQSEQQRIECEKALAEHMGWRYYLPEAEQTPDVRQKLSEQRSGGIKPEQITLIDPCMGSGHILVYAFDVLMQLYTAAGWDEREAAQSIIKNNLYGLDIDDRAAQLAYFAVMMKARQYDRRLFSRGIQPNIYSISESNNIDADAVRYFCGDDPALKAALGSITEQLRDAKEYGSILSIEPVDFDVLRARLDELRADISMAKTQVFTELQPLICCAEALARRYDVVVTNPPYMGGSGMSPTLGEFVKKNYPDSKSDLFAVFIERCGQMIKKSGYQAMITQHAWMFLSSFEKLRAKLMSTDIVNMAHLGARAFEEIGGEVVQTVSFVMRNSHISGYKGTYCRLIEPTTQQGKENMFLAGANRYDADQANFSKIPGSPVAYWVSEAIIKMFEAKRVNEYGTPRQGLASGDNGRFLRLWYEVQFSLIGIGLTDEHELDKKQKLYVPHNKGGQYRKWYGNLEYVICFSPQNREILSNLGNHLPSRKFYFKTGFTWSDLTTGNFGARYIDCGAVFDTTGPTFFVNGSSEKTLKYILGYFNSVTFNHVARIFCSGLHFSNGVIANLPCLVSLPLEDRVYEIADAQIDLSKLDWDAYETSWDFKRNPLV